MNVIRQGRGCRNGASANTKSLLLGTQKPRGRGRGALDFDKIQYRPGQRLCTSSSSSGAIRTPSNLQLQMAISSSAHRTLSSSTQDESSKNTSTPAKLTIGQSFKGKQNLFRTGSSSVSARTQSSSITPKYPWRGTSKTPRCNAFTPKSGVSNTPVTTPASATTSGDPHSYIVLAITEGRGYARGEVGMAVIDVKRPCLVLCQLSDRQTYSNTLTKVSVFNPAEILFPHTFVDSNNPNKLYHMLEEKFPFVQMTKVQRRLFRDSEGLMKVQSLCLPENLSCQLSFQDKFYALAASAALLKYVEFVQNVIFAPRSLKVVYQGAHHGAIIDVKTAKDLELLLNQQSNNATHTLVGMMNHCCTRGGSRLLRASLLHPPCSLPSITHRQDSVQELVENPEISQKLREVLQQLPDVERLLTLCMQTPSSIDSTQAMETRVNYVLMLKAAVDSLPLIAAALENAKSFILCKALKCLQDARGDLIRKRILETVNEDVKAPKGGKTATFQRCFAIKSGISELLDVARKTYCELVNDVHDHVIDLTSTHSLPLKMVYSVTKGYHIQIAFQRKKPIKKTDLPPYFLQVQSSRSSLTCTTDILIHANERINQITSEILSMTNMCLAVVLNDIRQYIGYLYDMCESVAEVDLILALAQLSCSHNYVRPKFGDHLCLKASRHPILESITAHVPISNNIEASNWQNLSIVTGPNMSGKSVYIKQVLLLQIMAQVGSYVPAEEATFRITDRIFSHLNFDDSIENNASTLALEMKEMQLIISSLTATSLVALDELCRGTSVEEGTAIAWALCEKLSESAAFVFVTTHFQELTKLGTMYPFIKNLYLETVEQEFSDKKVRLVYTHQLLCGVNPVQNYGLRLAESLGVPEDVIEKAKSVSSLLKSTAQEKLKFASLDEAQVLAFYFHKLKALMKNAEFCKEKLLSLQSDFQGAFHTAAEQSILMSNQKPLARKESNNIIFPELLSSPENQLEEDNHPIPMNNTARTKLCEYSSSSTLSSFSRNSSERRREESTPTKVSGPPQESPNYKANSSSANNSDYTFHGDNESPGLSSVKSRLLDGSFISTSSTDIITLEDRADSMDSNDSYFSHDTLPFPINPVSHFSPNHETNKFADNFSKCHSSKGHSDFSVSMCGSESPPVFSFKSKLVHSPFLYQSLRMSTAICSSISDITGEETVESMDMSATSFDTSVVHQEKKSSCFLEVNCVGNSSPQNSFNFLNQNACEEKLSLHHLFRKKNDVGSSSQHVVRTPEEISPRTVTNNKMSSNEQMTEVKTPVCFPVGNHALQRSKLSEMSDDMTSSPILCTTRIGMKRKANKQHEMKSAMPGNLSEEKRVCPSGEKQLVSSQKNSHNQQGVGNNLFGLQTLMESYNYLSDSSSDD